MHHCYGSTGAPVCYVIWSLLAIHVPWHPNTSVFQQEGVSGWGVCVCVWLGSGAFCCSPETRSVLMSAVTARRCVCVTSLSPDHLRLVAPLTTQDVQAAGDAGVRQYECVMTLWQLPFITIRFSIRSSAASSPPPALVSSFLPLPRSPLGSFSFPFVFLLYLRLTCLPSHYVALCCRPRLFSSHLGKQPGTKNNSSSSFFILPQEKSLSLHL